jgi:hypothetical protein
MIVNQQYTVTCDKERITQHLAFNTVPGCSFASRVGLPMKKISFFIKGVSDTEKWDHPGMKWLILQRLSLLVKKRTI